MRLCPPRAGRRGKPRLTNLSHPYTGFCEYYDVDTAASAVRNLNGVAEVRGRLLRVDFAQPDIKDLPKDQRGARDKNGLPPLPPGVILPPGVSPAESIHKTLQNMPPAQLLDVLHQMRVS